MSWPISLRLLLSLLLVLNGVGDAFARVGPPIAVHATAHPTTGACHAHGDPMHAAPTARHPAGQDAGCCSAGMDDCACLQHAGIVVAAAALPGPPRLRIGPVGAGPSMHMPPWLPQPIRPPIPDRPA